MSKKQVMIISPSIPPYAGSGVYRNIRFIRHLDRLGWEVSVLSIRENCIRENLPRDSALLQKIPERVHLERAHATRLFEALLHFRGGSEKTSKRQQETPTRHTEEKAKLPEQRTVFQTLKDFISTLLRFPDHEIGWVPWAILKGLKTCKQKKIEVLYTSGPPHSCHLVGWALQTLTGLPWVADFRDPWTRQGWIDEATKLTWPHRRKVRMESAVVEHADRVILNTDEMRDDFSRYYSAFSPEKFVAIYNGYDPEDLTASLKKKVSNDIFTITHAGSLYKKRTPLGLLRAVSELINEQNLDPNMIRIRLIGRCDISGIHEEIKHLGLKSCVALIGWVTHQESLEAIAESDLLLLIQPGTGLQIPGKIFEYIMLKKQILALTDQGATQNIVEDYELGEVAEPMDVPAIKEIILRFYKKRLNDEPLPEGYQRALETFHAHSLAKDLDKTLLEVMHERRT